MACLLEAFRFVLAHRWPCLFRAVPVVLLTALVAWLETNILASAEYFRLVVNELLYAIFAVYWNRYTLLAEDRQRADFGLSFGLREIKFAGAMLVFVLISYLLARAFIGSFGVGSTSSVIVFMGGLVLVFMPLMFIFPAIALDQPLRLSLFASRTMEMMLPLIGTFLLGVVAVLGLYVLIYLPTLLLAVLQFAELAGPLFYLISSFLIMPFILAVSVSFVSLLFGRAIGLQPVTS